jgi:transposase-like protein
MSMFGKIRRMYFRDKLSVCEIARRTSLSRNTIKKWLACDRHSAPPLVTIAHFHDVIRRGRLRKLHA